MVAPRATRTRILEQVHGDPGAGHFGTRRTYNKVCQSFWWPGVRRDVQQWIKSCPICITTKPGEGKGKSPLQKETFGVRFARLGIDILSGLPETERRNVCIMVVQDYYTKFTRCYPLPNHTAPTCAEALMDWVLLFGTPYSIHTDQGREFESELWAQLCDKLNIKKTRTNAYRPQSDGLVERFNRTLIESLSTMVNSTRDDWDEKVPYAVFAYNSTVHATTGCTPNLLIFGEEALMPPDIVYRVPSSTLNPPCPVLFVENIQENLREGYEIARETSARSAEYRKRR